ncbi:MAG: hypothetical protein AAGI53_11030 [Planctomycetota bacterium]
MPAPRCLRRTLTAFATALLASSAAGQTVIPQTVTYQGRLDDANGAADGNFDFIVRQFDAAVGGTQVASSFHNVVPVVDGLFTIPDVQLSSIDTGILATFLQIEVRPTGTTTYAALSPRQPLTPAPVADTLRGFDVSASSDGGQLGSISTEGARPANFGASGLDGNGFIDLIDVNSGLLLAQLDVNALGSGATGLLNLGSTGGRLGGNIEVENDAGIVTFDLIGGSATGGTQLETFTESGGITMRFLSDNGDGSFVQMVDPATDLTTLLLTGRSAGGGSALTMFAEDGTSTVFFDSDSGGGGTATIRAEDGSSTVFLDGESNGSGGRISARNDISEETVAMIGDDGADAGLIEVINRNGSTINVGIQLRGRDTGAGTGGEIRIFDNSGNQTFEIDGQDTTGGRFQMNEPDGSIEARFFSNTLTLYNGDGVATITMNGNTGAKNGIVSLPTFGERLMYAVESTEVWFDDIGSAQLVNGKATILLDPMFLEAVVIDEANPLKVFVTLTGPANGVWVEKFANGFVVHELMNGSSNATFDFRIVAKRRGLEHARMERFADVDAVSLEQNVVGRVQTRRVDGDDIPQFAPKVESKVQNDRVSNSAD